MKTLLKYTVYLAVIVLVAYGARQTLFKPKPVEVSLYKVDRGLVESSITNSKAGTLEARPRAGISPDISGIVVAIHHREGARVETGEILLLLDAGRQRAALHLAEADVSLAEQRLSQAALTKVHAKREWKRNQALLEKRIASPETVDLLHDRFKDAEAAHVTVSSQLARARTARESALVDLAKTELRAPFDGVVAELNVEIGEMAMPSSPSLPVPPVIDMFDPDSVYVSAPMDEVDGARIEVGQTLRITLDSVRDKQFKGRVRRVSAYVLDVEQQNRTLEVEAVFEEKPERGLLPGVSADVEIILERRESVLRIPSYALMEGNRVLVLAGDGVLAERVVETGLRNWAFVEITKGLAEGESIVTTVDSTQVKAGVLAVERTTP